ncbi:MAG: gliding motility protein RemB [Sphingobacteriaceae bacterium]
MKIKIGLLFAFILCSLASWGQSLYQPYSYSFYQKLNSSIYSTDTRIHSSLKPFLVDNSLMRPRFDSLMNLGVDTTRKGWVLRKLFNQHLIDVKNNEYTFYADFLPDLQIGRDVSGKRTTWLNTRGYQIGGTIGKKFSFYTNGFENQGVFPEYINDFINKYEIVPGQLTGKVGKKTQDWTYVTANVSYTPIKYLNISLGYDKNFIGDGYRSMLLSDVSSNYTALKLTGKLGNVQYLSMWAYMMDPLAPRLANDRGTGDRNKWGAFQYLDWNINNRASIGFFQSVTWAAKNAGGNRGFDFNYINPVIFLRPLESANTTSPDKMHLGLNGKYKAIKNMTLYGQFMLDEFTAKEFFSNKGYWANKWGAQLGLRGFDAFGIKNLNYLAEYNLARPYTYSHFQEITNYSNYGQPLAHPFGANFREFVSIWNYSIGRFDFQGQGNFGHYGLDGAGEDNGKDIFISYYEHPNNYGNYIGQGIETDLIYLDGKVSFLLNPKYNLRFELGGVYRDENNSEFHHRTSMITFGLRSSFRNLYYDF